MHLGPSAESVGSVSPVRDVAPEPVLHLPQVTLLAVDTRSPALALRALRHSLRHIRFARSLLLTHGAAAGALPRTEASPHGDIECVDIGPITSSADYSRFVLGGLLPHVQTTHVLIVQWDGFVIHPACWNPAFLATDYLGAPWGRARHGHRVGNGGFSLRSRRLLQALHDPALQARWHHPEDICIAQTLRDELQARHGIHFADLALAQGFAFENETPPGPCFGFHGLVNLHRALSAEELDAVLPQVPDSVWASRDGFKACRALLRDGHARQAAQVLQRRLAAGATDWRSRWLAWRAQRLAA